MIGECAAARTWMVEYYRVMYIWTFDLCILFKSVQKYQSKGPPYQTFFKTHLEGKGGGDFLFWLKAWLLGG